MPKPEGEPMDAVMAMEYSPLRLCGKSLQDLDDLLPRFVEVDEDLKRLRKILGNGELRWVPPEGEDE